MAARKLRCVAKQFTLASETGPSPFTRALPEHTPILFIPRTRKRCYEASLRYMHLFRSKSVLSRWKMVSTHVALGRHAQNCDRLGFCSLLLLAKEYFRNKE